MISEQDLQDAEFASKDPQQRFRFVEQIAARRLEMRYPDDTLIYDDFEYMCSVLPAARAYGIDSLSSWQVPSRNNADWREVCRDFRADATQVSQQILFEYAGRRAADPYSVALDPATKTKLRFHIEQLRSIIDGERIADWKKRELYDALIDLEREIDKARTPLASLIGVMSKALGGDIKVAEALQRIVEIFNDAKAVEAETARLSASVSSVKKIIGRAETKQLPPPRANAKKKSPAFDDDIPF